MIDFKELSTMTTLRSGIDTSSVDPQVRLNDDLFRHFNGKWLTENEIPQDRSSDGSFMVLRNEAEAQVKAIIESASGSPEAQKITDLFASFMNTARVEELASAPILEDLAKVDAIESLSDFISTMSWLEARGASGITETAIFPDMMDSASNILYIHQGGISLPDESYYREEQYAQIRKALVAHIEAMFGLVGIADGATKAQAIFDLESKIAAMHWDTVRNRDASLTYNKKSRAELIALSPALDWPLWMKAGEIPALAFDNVVVGQPSFFEEVSSLVASFESDPAMKTAWKAWLSWHVITGSAAYLNDAIVKENFNFFGTTLSGTPQIRERWKRGVSLVEGSLGEAIGKIYVELHFPPAAKARMEALVANLIAAYRVSISDLEWMSQATKSKAITKLEKFRPKIGYPDKWRDYSALEISADDLFGNLARVTKFERDFALAKIGKPVDRDEWHMTPQTVNAYYNPLGNEIVFPAAILQSPFFGLDVDDAANYGAIGAVIGHEIGHGFDDQGSKFDGDGNMVDWWAEIDRTEFEKRTSVLIEQYNVLVPEGTPDLTVNGALTVGENIGDLGGLAIALKAYLISLDGKDAPVIDGHTGIERLFLSWAQAWRGKVRPEEMRRRIATDPHSPAEFRCNQIVRNIPEFYQAFGITEADALWLDEDKRVAIW
jgi:putative endopeptidase